VQLPNASADWDVAVLADDPKQNRTHLVKIDNKVQLLEVALLGRVEACDELDKGSLVIERECVCGPKDEVRLLVELTADRQDCQGAFHLAMGRCSNSRRHFVFVKSSLVDDTMLVARIVSTSFFLSVEGAQTGANRMPEGTILFFMLLRGLPNLIVYPFLITIQVFHVNQSFPKEMLKDPLS